MSDFPPITLIPVTSVLPLLDGAVVRERQIMARPGETLRDILGRLTFHPDYAMVYVMAPSGAVYGPIPPAWWDSVRPRLGRTVVVQIVPHGGQSSSGGDSNAKDRFYAQLGVAIAAVLIGTLVGGQWGPVISAAIQIGGALLINALLPVEPNRLREITGQHVRERIPDSLSLTGSENRMNRYGPIPCIYGQTARWPAWR